MADRRTARTPSASVGSGSRQDSPATAKRHRIDRGEWRPAFLAALRNSGNVRAACRAADVSRQTVYEHRATDPEFAAAWQETLEEALDVLEAAAWSRAATSSDTLLMFLLRAHRPEVYRERVDLRLDGLREVKRLAQAEGVDEAAAVAEWERMLAEGKP
jgi:hypothetical protein